MPNNDIKEKAAKIRELAAALDIPIEKLLLAAGDMVPANAPVILDDEIIGQEPPHIVYPNIKFPRYVYREYPKLYYRGAVRDVEEPFILVKDGQQINAVRIVRDQFICENLEVKNKNEETMNTSGWFSTYVEARQDALAKRDARVASPYGEGVTVREAEPDPPQRKGPRRAA